MGQSSMYKNDMILVVVFAIKLAGNMVARWRATIN